MSGSPPEASPPAPATSPLTDAERRLVERQVEVRAKVAKQFAGLSALSVVYFLVRVWLRRNQLGRGYDWPLLAVDLGVVAIVGLLVWHFGHRPLARMRRDLAGGVKRELRGTITRLERHENAYGETITWATIGGRKLLARTDVFAASKEGDRVRVECLPESGLVFAVETLG